MCRSIRAALALSALSLAGCAQPGAEAGASFFDQAQINTRQKAQVVNILAVMPARVQVSNAQNQREGQIAGALIGALAGAGLGAGLGHHDGLAAGTVGAVGGRGIRRSSGFSRSGAGCR